MKRLKLALVVLLVLGLAAPVLCAEVALHGDFNNRFMVYTDQAGLFAGPGDQTTAANRQIADDGVSDSWGEIKYRLWVDAATNDDKVKAVYGIELGALHFGDSNDSSGDFSGDGVNIETRMAYTDFQLPWVENKARLKIGLQPMDVSYYLWKETAMGVNFESERDSFDYQLAWLRGYEHQRDNADGGDDVDAFLGRLNLKPAEGFKVGVFGLYTTSNAPGSSPETPGQITAESYQIKRFAHLVDLDLWNFGIDGSYNAPMRDGKFFINWDLIYQTGDIDNVSFLGSDGIPTDNASVDVSAYFAHVDVGFGAGDWKFTYTFWYASGDDNSGDADFEGFVSYDVDSFDGVVLFEALTDDNYFTERHYLLDKGFIMNKIALDYQATPKLKVGAAALYMMTAEDIEYTAAQGQQVAEDEVGIEIDVFSSYKLFDNMTFNVAAGYLFAGDAMDYWEADDIQNGSSDEDILKINASVRYKF